MPALLFAASDIAQEAPPTRIWKQLVSTGQHLLASVQPAGLSARVWKRRSAHGPSASAQAQSWALTSGGSRFADHLSHALEYPSFSLSRSSLCAQKTSSIRSDQRPSMDDGFPEYVSVEAPRARPMAALTVSVSSPVSAPSVSTIWVNSFDPGASKAS